MAAWIVATKTERASNLTSSQCVIELAVRVAEKESLTLFLSDGISPPSDNAKLSKIFEIDALMAIYSTKIKFTNKIHCRGDTSWLISS